eukprot:Rmarinus@m.20122
MHSRWIPARWRNCPTNSRLRMTETSCLLCFSMFNFSFAFTILHRSSISSSTGEKPKRCRRCRLCTNPVSLTSNPAANSTHPTLRLLLTGLPDSCRSLASMRFPRNYSLVFFP